VSQNKSLLFLSHSLRHLSQQWKVWLTQWITG
jgi:hypothetical protein